MNRDKSLRRLLGVGASFVLILPLLSTAAAPSRFEQSSSGMPGALRPSARDADGEVNDVGLPVRGMEVRPGTPARAASVIQPRVDQAYGKLPLSFETNRGQTDRQVKFLARGSSSTLFLTSTEAVLVLTNGKPRATQDRFPLLKTDLTRPEKVTRTVVRTKLVGANPEPRVTGLEELPGKVNYFIGNDPDKWRTNVPTYARVQYRDVYPGVNLVYYGNQRQLEYDFVVAPGADPKAIRLAFEGVDKLTLDAQGSLILHIRGGEVVQRAPLVYQEINGARREISGRYVLQGRDRVGFQLAVYDRTRPLVIDPVLVYSTYLGGSGDFEGGNSIAVDASGSAYVSGTTQSTDFPTANPLQPAFTGSQDAFVAKLNPTGSALVYSTYLGGSGGAEGLAIAVDSSGNAYVTGDTNSTDFPTVNAAQPTFGGGFDAFVAKLNPTGSALVYSTYLGGSDSDGGSGIAVDAADNAYVTGGTGSPNFPTVNPLQPAAAGGVDAFVAKFDPAGALVYSTYLGGSGGVPGDKGSGIAVDAAGNVYVAGATSSTDFPTVNALQAACGGCSNFLGRDAFVAKLNPTGSALVYSTYLGGSNSDVGLAIALDSLGNAYVTGITDSTDFPTMNAAQPAHSSGARDAFVAKIDPTGALVYSTYLGGASVFPVEAGTRIAVDAAGSAYVTGLTDSTDFPTVNSLQPFRGADIFVVKLNPTGAALVYSTSLGPGGGSGIAVDAAGNAYLTGFTTSTDFPTVNPLQPASAGGFEAFVAKLNPAIPSFNSPSGSNVKVPLSSEVVVTFPDISSQGSTTVTTSSTGPTPPAGFSLGDPPTYYDIMTTATFTPPVTVCITPSAEFTDPSSLRLFHFEDGAWVDVTTSNNDGIICGQVGSFSLFVIAQRPIISVTIDIKPGNFPNTINLGSKGTVPVAILSTDTFDARTVDPTTVTLASAPVRLKGKGTAMASFEDVNGDGRLDLVVQVVTEALQLSQEDTTATLEGRTFAGNLVMGTDSIRVVP